MAGMKQVLRLSWGISNNGYHNNNNKENGRNDNNNNITMTKSDNKTRLQALALINDCYKYKMDLTTNGVVITDIKFVHSNKEKLTMSKKEDDKESSEPDYDEDKDQLEQKQEDIEQEKTNNGICHYCFGL